MAHYKVSFKSITFFCRVRFLVIIYNTELKYIYNPEYKILRGYFWFRTQGVLHDNNQITIYSTSRTYKNQDWQDARQCLKILSYFYSHKLSNLNERYESTYSIITINFRQISSNKLTSKYIKIKLNF